MKTNLSKSKYLVGLQCPKRLWLESYRRDLLPPIPAARERVFSQGHEVGILARERFPGGILINEDPFQWQAALEETRAALATGATPGNATAAAIRRCPKPARAAATPISNIRSASVRPAPTRCFSMRRRAKAQRPSSHVRSHWASNTPRFSGAGPTTY